VRTTVPETPPHSAPIVNALRHHVDNLVEIVAKIGAAELASSASAAGGPDQDAVEAMVSRLLQQAGHRTVVAQLSYAAWPVTERFPVLERLHSGLLEHRGMVRILIPRDALVDDENMASVRTLSERSAHIRVHPYTLPTTAILDGALGAVAAVGEGEDRLVAVRDGDVVRALQAFYNTIWSHAITLADMPEESLSWPEDSTAARVLRLLCLGYTDEAAARKLGLSVRTYRRYVAELMHHMKANSRFQAGVRATQLGLARD
jgi:DNA-binding CsgD family transcriptional regulator